MRTIKIILTLFFLFLLSLDVILAQNNCFTRLPGIDLQCMYAGNAQWIDFNGDGKQDLFVSGYDDNNTSKYVYMYQNNGDKTFSDVSIPTAPKLFGLGLAWGDYDNDGYTDLFFSGAYNNSQQAKLYRNNGTGIFSEINSPFVPLSTGKSQFIDIDNDGKTDFFQLGFDKNNVFTITMYQNKGNGDFEEKNTDCFKKLAGSYGNFSKNDAIWADFDNDGLLDVVIAATTYTDFYFKFYKNLGDFRFKEVDIGLPKLNYVSMAAGDVNQDGKTDLVYIGSTESMLGGSYNYAEMKILINYGNLKFKVAYSTIANIFDNNMELADFNNDGYPDILYYGTDNGYLNLYKNNKNNTFSLTTQNNIAQAYHGAATWGDLDNDNDLDLFFSGELVPSGQKISYLYENTITAKNQKPLPPTEITLKAKGNQLIAEWNAGSDDSTKTVSLRYLVRAGTAQHPDSIISGIADYERLKRTSTSRNYILNNAPEGKYYISVQTVDNSWNRSEFSEKKEVLFRHPKKIWGDTLTINYGDSVKLAPGAVYKSFNWTTGETGTYIYAKKEGQYSVNLIDGDGYLSDESVYVKVLGTPVVVIPEKDWYLGVGGPNADEGYGVATDKQGNVYVTGKMSSSIVFGTDTLLVPTYSSNQSMFLLKLNKYGDLLWSKSGKDKYAMDAGGYGVMVDKDNNVLVYGSFANDFAFADTTILATLNNSEKLFVAKLNPDGQRIWVKGFGNVERPDQGIYIKSLFGTVDNENKIIIAGLTSEYGTKFDNIVFNSCSARDVMFVLKIDGSGKAEWAKGASNVDQNAPTGITTDKNNNIYVSGYNYGNSTFFYTDPSSQIINKCALLKLTPTGNIDWSISGGGGLAVTSDAAGNVYAIGNWASSSNDINLDISKPNSILKIDTTGKIKWQKVYNGNPVSLKTDNTGNLYYLAQRTDYTSEPYIVDTDTVAAGNRFLCKMDSAAQVIYLKTTGTNGNYNDMAVDSKENVLVTGRYYRATLSDSVYRYISYVDTVRHITYYNSIVIGNEITTNDGNWNIFIAKYCNELKKDLLNNGIVKTPVTIQLILYPNPANENITIPLPTFENQEAVSVDIYTIKGERVKTLDLRSQHSSHLKIDCRDMSAGLYFATIRTKMNTYTGKIIIKRN
ncbi:MAG: FG-GAP-like repeat-containing protein [Bacteroidota bacterium]|nr:FG-GAP-like repeat-containing protein [Bacteroidota bacterium]